MKRPLSLCFHLRLCFYLYLWLWRCLWPIWLIKRLLFLCYYLYLSLSLICLFLTKQSFVRPVKVPLDVVYGKWRDLCLSVSIFVSCLSSTLKSLSLYLFKISVSNGSPIGQCSWSSLSSLSVCLSLSYLSLSTCFAFFSLPVDLKKKFYIQFFLSFLRQKGALSTRLFILHISICLNT